MITMTREQFINREVSVWGEDYIFDLLDRGFEPVLLSNKSRDFSQINGDTHTKWTWIKSQANDDHLTHTEVYATVGVGVGCVVSPVSAYRASE